MKKKIGLFITLAAFPMLCVGGAFKVELIAKLAGITLLITGALLADLFDKKQNPQSQTEPAVEQTGWEKHDDRNPYPEE